MRVSLAAELRAVPASSGEGQESNDDGRLKSATEAAGVKRGTQSAAGHRSAGPSIHAGRLTPALRLGSTFGNAAYPRP